jgi:hypothetical protein
MDDRVSGFGTPFCAAIHVGVLTVGGTPAGFLPASSSSPDLGHPLALATGQGQVFDYCIYDRKFGSWQNPAGFLKLNRQRKCTPNDRVRLRPCMRVRIREEFEASSSFSK